MNEEPKKQIRNLLPFGTLTGGVQAALSLIFTEDLAASKFTVVLTGTNFTVAGLATTASNPIGQAETVIVPSLGGVGFAGPTMNTNLNLGTRYVIPTFSYGTTGLDSDASQLGASNPFLVMGMGVFSKLAGHANDDISNFVGTATYTGTFATKGINTTPQTITFSNGQVLSISFQQAVPEPSFALLCGLAGFGLVSHRRRN